MPEQNSPNSDPQFQQPAPEKTLIGWTSPSRLYHKYSKDFFTSVGTIMFLVCVILLFLKQIGFILAIISFGFFIYVIDNVKPENTQHRITNKGIFTNNKMFFWDQLGRFWIIKEYSKDILYIENYLGLPPRLFMILDSKDIKTTQDTLKKYLVMQKPELTQVERWSKWLSEKITLESPKKPSPKK